MDCWRTQAVDLLRTIDADAFGTAYVLCASDVGGMPAGCAGITGALLDRQLRQYLESSGQWQGPGFCCVIDTDQFNGRYDGDREAALLHAVVHEAAHHAAIGRAAMLAKPDSELEPMLLAALRSVDFDSLPMIGVAPGPLWEHHGAEFIRANLHLHYRAWHLAQRLLWLDMLSVAGPTYGLSPAELYVEALGDEPERCNGWSMLDVIETPAPAAFLELFAKDISDG